MGPSCLLYMSQMLHDQSLRKGGVHALILANASAVTFSVHALFKVASVICCNALLQFDILDRCQGAIRALCWSVIHEIAASCIILGLACQMHSQLVHSSKRYNLGTCILDAYSVYTAATDLATGLQYHAANLPMWLPSSRSTQLPHRLLLLCKTTTNCSLAATSTAGFRRTVQSMARIPPSITGCLHLQLGEQAKSQQLVS